MQGSVLETIDSRQLAVYAVWEPILRTDDERSARKATALFPDERVQNYWGDVYLVYPSGVTWNEDGPPRPEFFQHQLGGRIPDSQRLDGPELAGGIRKLLAR